MVGWLRENLHFLIVLVLFLRLDRPGFKSHLPDVWTSVSLSFPIYKIGITVVQLHRLLQGEHKVPDT